MKLVILFLFLMLGVFCSAALGDDWDSFASQDDGTTIDDEEGAEGTEEDLESIVVEKDDVVVSDDLLSSNGAGYTDNFYFALGVAGFGVFLVLLFAYLFFRKPKNKWERKVVK